MSRACDYRPSSKDRKHFDARLRFAAVRIDDEWVVRRLMRSIDAGEQFVACEKAGEGDAALALIAGSRRVAAWPRCRAAAAGPRQRTRAMLQRVACAQPAATAFPQLWSTSIPAERPDIDGLRLLSRRFKNDRCSAIYERSGLDTDDFEALPDDLAERLCARLNVRPV